MRTSTSLRSTLLALLCLLLVSCAAPQPSGLSDDQMAALTAEMLTAMNENDYAAFSRAFSPDLTAAISESEFGPLREMILAASGRFLEVGSASLSNTNGFALYRFACQFEREQVVVTVSMLVGGDELEGLWFDSPNLRSGGQ